MPKLRDHTTINSRVYLRKRGNGGPGRRYWADFRDFAKVGGKQEPLMPAGATQATTDEKVAKRLAAARLEEFQKRLIATPCDDEAERQLGPFAAHHLEQKAIAGEADAQWLASAQLHLETACEFFGATTDLADIKVKNCSLYMKHLSRLSNGRSGYLARGTITHYLNTLSSLFRRAISEEIISLGTNPGASYQTVPCFRYIFGMCDSDDIDRLTALLVAIRSFEEAADRIELSGSMLQYPARARAMAIEHRTEARALWRLGVRPRPGTVLPSRQPPSDDGHPDAK